jgi:hypothetical protein
MSQDAAFFANYLVTFRRNLLLPSVVWSKKTHHSWTALNRRKHAILKRRCIITNQHGVTHQAASAEQQHCENLRVHPLEQLMSRAAQQLQIYWSREMFTLTVRRLHVMKPTWCTMYVCLFRHYTLHVSGLLVAHHQEVTIYVCNNWYVLYTVDPRVRPTWHTNNLGYDQTSSFDFRPKSWVTTRMPVKAKTCIHLCGCKQRHEMRL